MKATELLSLIMLLGCTNAKHGHPGVRFISDLQYDSDFESLAETSSNSYETSNDVESWIHGPQSLTDQQIMEYSYNIKNLNDDPEKVYGASQPLGVFNTRNNAPVGTADDDWTKPVEDIGIDSDMSVDEKQTFNYLAKQH